MGNNSTAVAKTEQKEVAPPQAGKGALIAMMAAQRNMDPTVFLNTVKAICFPDGKGTNEQLAAFLMVAQHYQLDPFTKEIFAFPGKGGGVNPIVSIDGWISMMNRHPQMDGLEVIEEEDENGKPYSCTVKIWRKDRRQPFIVTEYLSECRRNTDPWNQKPRRMLRHKATIQAARYAFGYGGVHDADDFGMDETRIMSGTYTSEMLPDDSNTSEAQPIQQPRRKSQRPVDENQAAPAAKGAAVETDTPADETIDTYALYEFGRAEGLHQEQVIEIAQRVSGGTLFEAIPASMTDPIKDAIIAAAVAAEDEAKAKGKAAAK